jgi:hypothetical protein
MGAAIARKHGCSNDILCMSSISVLVLVEAESTNFEVSSGRRLLLTLSVGWMGGNGAKGITGCAARFAFTIISVAARLPG